LWRIIRRMRESRRQNSPKKGGVGQIAELQQRD